jgi:dTDP-D-glucose 4,6-dehydratase
LEVVCVRSDEPVFVDEKDFYVRVNPATEKIEGKELINYVKDRSGHDKRYAIDASKIENELGWTPKYEVEVGIEETVNWYLENKEWVKNIVSGEYLNYYKEQYVNR